MARRKCRDACSPWHPTPRPSSGARHVQGPPHSQMTTPSHFAWPCSAVRLGLHCRQDGRCGGLFGFQHTCLPDLPPRYAPQRTLPDPLFQNVKCAISATSSDWFSTNPIGSCFPNSTLQAPANASTCSHAEDIIFSCSDVRGHSMASFGLPDAAVTTSSDGRSRHHLPGLDIVFEFSCCAQGFHEALQTHASTA